MATRAIEASCTQGADDDIFGLTVHHGGAVTVCVATISTRSSVFGASDRMLTSGDVEFEPHAPKVVPLTNSMVLMSAGDAGVQAEVASDMRVWIADHIAARPDVWILVRDAAEAYAQYFAEARRRKVELALLRPLGLTSELFIARQGELAPALARDLATEMLSFPMPAVACIVAGVDASGPHLYVVADGQLHCADSVGFCAIGSGASHAESLLMFAKYHPGMAPAEAMLLTFAAKKRSEVAPGVGSETDMFTIGPMPGMSNWLDAETLQNLGEMYTKWRTAETEAFNDATERSRKYVQALAEAATKQPQAITPDGAAGGSGASADEEGLPSPSRDERGHTGRPETTPGGSSAGPNGR